MLITRPSLDETIELDPRNRELLERAYARRAGAGAGRRRGHRGFGRASKELPARIAGLFSWYRADFGITTPGGAVSSWASKYGTHADALTQAVGAAQATHYNSVAALGNRAGVYFDGGDQAVDNTASHWTWMHDGSGMTWVIVAKCDVDNTIYGFGGTSNSTTAIGTRLRTNGTGALIWDMGNGVANLLGVTVQANVDSAFFKATVRYEEGRAGNEYATRYNGGADLTGNSAAAPSAAAPAIPFTLGGTTLTLTGYIAEAIFYQRYITDAEAGAIDAYTLARYGI